MAVQDPGLDIGYLTASADLSSSQFLAVKPYASADREVALESTGGLLILGILQNKPTTGQCADVRFVGISKAIYGGTVTRGQALMTNTSGQLITATGTNQVVAIALESGVINDIHAVFVCPNGQQS